jgi:hypothetical protein
MASGREAKMQKQGDERGKDSKKFKGTNKTVSENTE